MADIVYNPLYQPVFDHQDWQDNVDIVQAGGENGFNAKFQTLKQEFNALKKEFNRLSEVITQINGSLVPVVPTTTLTFAPNFSVNSGETAWTLNNGIASKSAGQPNANGWIPLQLPNQTRISSMAVIGDKNGSVGSGSLVVQLLRQSISGAITTLLGIEILDSQPNSFNISVPVPATNSLVDNQAYKYLVTAEISSVTTTTVMRIFAIQIICGKP
jgi:hypothetical protein